MKKNGVSYGWSRIYFLNDSYKSNIYGYDFGLRSARSFAKPIFFSLITSKKPVRAHLLYNFEVTYLLFISLFFESIIALFILFS